MLDKDPLRVYRFRNLGFANNARVDESYLSANYIIEELASGYDVKVIDLTRNSVFDNIPLYKGNVIFYDKHHFNEFGAKEHAKQSAIVIKNALFQ